MEEIIYNIITYFIITFALFVAVIKIYRSVFLGNKPNCENGCGGCTSKCELKNIDAL